METKDIFTTATVIATTTAAIAKIVSDTYQKISTPPANKRSRTMRPFNTS